MWLDLRKAMHSSDVQTAVGTLKTPPMLARNAKDSPCTVPYEIRVVEICQWVADDDGIDTSSLCCTEDRAQVTGLLDTLKHDY